MFEISLCLKFNNFDNLMSNCFNFRSIENTDVDTLLFDRLGRFLRTHSVKVDLKGSDILGAIESAGRSLEDITDDGTEEGRGKKSK